MLLLVSLFSDEPPAGYSWSGDVTLFHREREVLLAQCVHRRVSSLEETAMVSPSAYLEQHSTARPDGQ